ncbi:hypothetical protein M422DRAFT_778028 [Sphaerobolus stellatus SS14]|uniref:Uncharacterized protein n=1 Tax=Sphaerobolus stellatus (strain SS14) TaxID=990650 RepID=A0A0C9UW51_SPHS4|nr:hypothetical protein M422DRAFT_778028 [Sphaerobolus stellatus SS14]
MDLILRPLSGISFGSPFSPRANGFGAHDEPGGRRRGKIPIALRPNYAIPTIVIMVLLAIGIEVATFFSQKNHGFKTGNRLSTDTVQWLSGFLPTLLVAPLVWMWRGVDNGFKRLQPYVNMSRGPFPPEESVLMDFEHASLITVIKKSFRFGYFLVFSSSLIVALNILLHPMAGSFFLVKPAMETGPSPDPVRNINQIGLNPNYKDITAFVAAAGFAEAAAFHNLSDPPFISKTWAVAQFQFPVDVTRNSTITVNTTGILTNVGCSKPASSQLNQPSNGSGNWTLSASLGQGTGCQVSQSIDISAATNQYGVEALTGCSPTGGGTQFEAPFAPAFFWFYAVRQSTGQPDARGIFCFPKIEAHDVTVTVDGATSLLVSVNSTGTVDSNSNNVTSGGFAGKAFNGIAFESAADFNLSDTFVNARALSVESGIPGSIFRVASDPNNPMGGLDNVFDDPNGFLDLTTKIYTQYLSITASSNYFVAASTNIKADLTLWPNRLWISARNAHALTALLLLVAFTGTVLHLIHRQQRKRLYLASRPGSFAHYMSLLPDVPPGRSQNAPSKETPSLSPYDSKRAMRKKLNGLEFMMDQRGKIVPVIPMQNMQPATPGPAGTSRDPLYTPSEDPEKALLDDGVEPFTDYPSRPGPSS